jgi:hypothetical protein
MNKIKKFIKWVIDETKGIYYDIREWKRDGRGLRLCFSGSCVFLWAIGLLYFFYNF